MKKPILGSEPEQIRPSKKPRPKAKGLRKQRTRRGRDIQLREVRSQGDGFAVRRSLEAH